MYPTHESPLAIIGKGEVTNVKKRILVSAVIVPTPLPLSLFAGNKRVVIDCKDIDSYSRVALVSASEGKGCAFLLISLLNPEFLMGSLPIEKKQGREKRRVLNRNSISTRSWIVTNPRVSPRESAETTGVADEMRGIRRNLKITITSKHV